MKKFFSILLLSIFLLSQYGKIASYLYCKWKAEIARDCKCETILTSPATQEHDHFAKLNPLPKWDESFIFLLSSSPGKCCTIILNNSSIAAANLAQGYAGNCFHPPAFI